MTCRLVSNTWQNNVHTNTLKPESNSFFPSFVVPLRRSFNRTAMTTRSITFLRNFFLSFFLLCFVLCDYCRRHCCRCRRYFDIVSIVIGYKTGETELSVSVLHKSIMLSISICRELLNVQLKWQFLFLLWISQLSLFIVFRNFSDRKRGHWYTGTIRFWGKQNQIG